MISGKTGFTPHVIEFLPVDQTSGAINAGYSQVILNKIEEMDKKGELITAPIIQEKLNIGKTTVIKHMTKLHKAGVLNKRLAKIRMEHTVVITPVYTMKKKKNAKKGG